MGFSFKRAAKFASGGYALGKIGDAIGGRKASPYGTFDQRGVGDVQWDPNTGMPIGLTGAIDPRNALAFQQRANEMVALRNQRRRSDASAFLEQGLRASETFRPGGYAAMSSGLYGQRAQLAFQDQIDAPDLLAGYREQTRVDTANAQRRAAKRAFLGNAISSIASLGAAAMTGGGSAAAAAAGAGVGASMALRANNQFEDTTFDDAYSEYMKRRASQIGGLA